MKRVLLCWEAGAGRGHVVTLARIARALKGLADCDAALGWMDHAREIAPFCTMVFPGVGLPYDREGRKARNAPPAASWAEYLHDCGFHDGERLRANVSWWLDTFHKRAIDLVIGDYAPCALLAARIAGLPALAVGTGYGIPPATLNRFPVFLADFDEREADEQAMVATINTALSPLGLPPLSALPQVYARSGDLLRTLPLLDPYRAHRTGAYLPPVADFGGVSDGQGREIFCYFSTSEFANPALIEALAGCGLPLRCYLPGAPEETRARLAAAGAIVEDKPVPVQDIIARSRMVFNSGQHGILCLALAGGLPQLCLPQHLEQLYHARQAEAAGAAHVVWPRTADRKTLTDALRHVWNHAGMAERARAMAHQLSGQLVPDDGPALRAALAPWLRD